MIRRVYQKNWRNVRSFLSSPAAKVTPLIPIVGYSIILGDFFAPLWSYEISLGETNIPSVNWRPRFVYFGLLSIAIAQVIFWTRCPKIARNYPDAEQFASGLASHLQKVSAPNSSSASTKLDVLLVSHGVRGVGGPSNTNADGVRGNACDKLFEILDTKNLFSANLCVFWLSLGLALLSVPALDLFIRVVATTLGL